MTTFDDRENAFENKYAHDQEMQFKAVARRNKLVGLWAAELMGRSGDDAASYAREVIKADFEEAGHDDVVRKLSGDLGDLADEALAMAETALARGDRPQEVPVGSVGAGTGATVGKALGPAQGMKGGFGFASITGRGGDGAGEGGDGPTVAAAVAINAFGDVRDPDTGRLLAGCRVAPDSSELASAEKVLAGLPPGFDHTWEGNTTLAVVMTDAALSRTALSKVCQMAFGGFYRALAPALSLYDGDLVVALSLGQREAHTNQVGVLAARAVERAIVRGVMAADGFGIVPAARDLRDLR